MKVPKSLIHYVQTVGLAEYVSVSLTAAKALHGTDFLVSHTSSLFQSLPVLAREAVAVLWPVAPCAVGVTLLTVVGVLVAIETIWTCRNTAPFWGIK